MYAGNSVVVNFLMRWPVLIPIAASVGVISYVYEPPSFLIDPPEIKIISEEPPKIQDPVIIKQELPSSEEIKLPIAPPKRLKG